MESEHKIALVKRLDLHLARLEQEVHAFLDELQRGTGAREIALVRTHLQDAYHWNKEAWSELEKEGETQRSDQEK